MRKIHYAAPLVALALLTNASLGAQERRQGGPPPYDPSKEVTVSGTVAGVETIEAGPDVKRVILMLTIENAPLAVILGPDVWVGKQGVPFTKGATAQVVGLTGYRANSNPAIMPRLVTIGSKTLTVRDVSGKPLWDQ